MTILKSIDRYEPSSYLDLTFTGPINLRTVGRYIASEMETILGAGNVCEMAAADASSHHRLSPTQFCLSSW